MNKRNRFWRQAISFITIGLIAVILWVSLSAKNTPQTQQVPISQVVQEAKDSKLSKIDVKGNQVIATTKDNVKLIAFKEASQGLKDYGITGDQVPITVENPDSGAAWSTILSILLPMLLLVGFIYYMARQARAGNSQAMSFGKTTASVYDGRKKTSFKDVAGLQHAKQELVEIVEFLKTPAKFKKLGAEIPRGVLLVGPAGVGKTLLAKAVAGEAEVPFFSISASEFVEMFVGVGASRVRDLFLKAKKTAPSVIFVDELDAVGRQRGTGLGGSHDEREQTLNQILVEMDGFNTEESVIVIAATNRPDVLDPALLRPGRFDRKVVLDLPDRKEREEILKIHCLNKPISPDLSYEEIAKTTPGLSGADLKNVANEAAILAARDNKSIIDQKDFRRSIEKVILGPERLSHLMGDKEREIVAYHEAGHAIIGASLSELDIVHKVSIVSRGMALGYTLSLPEEEKRLISKSKFEQEIAQLLAGRAAEKLVLNEITTGASNDLDRATRIARDMVTVFGMSELGPIKYGEQEEMVFLGREMGLHKTLSDATTAKIDAQITIIIDNAWNLATSILKRELKTLKKMAKVLLDKETLEDDDLALILTTLSTKKA